MDKQGNIWFTANFKAYIGKLDTKTGKFTEYPLDPEARDPHTPIFDQKGTLWFSVQGANMVGRLNTETGESKVVTSPTPKSNPYGMVVTTKGIPYFVEFGANKIAASIPRRWRFMNIFCPMKRPPASRCNHERRCPLYYSDYGRGYLGRFDTKTGKMTADGLPPADLNPGHTESPSWTASSGTAKRESDPIRSCASIQNRKIPNLGNSRRRRRGSQHDATTTDGKLVLTESGENVVAL